MEPITIVVPGVPRGKGRPRFSGKSRTTYTDNATRAYEESVGRLASIAMRGKDMLSGALHLDLRAHFPIPASWTRAKRDAALTGCRLPTSVPDLDNIQKAITDGMNGIVYADDAAIVSARCSKVYAAGEPFVVATVQPIASPHTEQAHA